MSTLRRAFGRWLRTWADRVDWRGAPRCLTGHSFTYETGEGLRFREDGRGCRLWVLGEDDYNKAHSEADSAAEDLRAAQWRGLLDIAMTEPDPVVAGEAAAALHRHVFESPQERWLRENGVERRSGVPQFREYFVPDSER